MDHQIKRVRFLGREVPVVCQNRNGPCPLIAISNVLLLRGTIALSEHARSITTQQLIQVVGNHVMEANPLSDSPERRSMQAKAIDDVLSVLPTLSRGLDVNVGFTSTTAFEFTSQAAVFDMVDIRLVHGWIVDPTKTDTARALGTKSYNQVVERVVGAGDSKAPEAGAPVADPSAMTETRLLDAFLKETASQLTFEGLGRLHRDLRDNELAVLFRNDHFSTIFKRGGLLYLLVTDEGFLRMSHVVWEHLATIDGDTVYVTDAFTPSPATAAPRDVSEDADSILAMYLQAQEHSHAGGGAAPATGTVPVAAPGVLPVALPVGAPGPAAGYPAVAAAVGAPPPYSAGGYPAAAGGYPAAAGYPPTSYVAPPAAAYGGGGAPEADPELRAALERSRVEVSGGGRAGAPPVVLPTSALAPGVATTGRTAPAASPAPSAAARPGDADSAALRAAIEISKRDTGRAGRGGASSAAPGRGGAAAKPFYHSSGDMYAAQAAELRALAASRHAREGHRAPPRSGGSAPAKKKSKGKKCTIM